MPVEVIGRSSELEAGRRLLDRATSDPAALLFEGEAGIGKSTLWEAVVADARARGVHVIACRPARGEAGLALGGLGDLIADAGDDAMASLPGPQRHALDVALLRTDAVGPPPDRRAISVATASVIKALARAEPGLIVAVDDAQWLDASSEAILSFALHRLGGHPVGVLLAVRSQAAGPVPLEADRGVAADRFERVHVGPMPLAGLHHLFEARLGHSFPRLTLIRIEEASGGNPFYALEIALAIERSGIAITPGQALPIPVHLGDLVRGRIDALPKRTRQVLLLVALAGAPTIEDLAGATGLDPVEALKPALAEGIVAMDDGVVRIAHPLLAATLLEAASPAQRRAAHERLATALTGEQARAMHLGLSTRRPGETTAHALAAAAEAARSRGAAVEAAALYERAAALTPNDRREAATERATLAAECLLVDLSEYRQADTILQRAIERAEPGPARASATSLRAIVWYYHGRHREAQELCRRALTECGDDRVLRARILLRSAFLSQLDLERALAFASEAAYVLEREPDGVDPDLMALALLERALLELHTVRRSRPGDLDRALALMTPDGASWELMRAHGAAYGLARLTDDLPRALSMAQALQDLTGIAGGDPFRWLQISDLQCFLGDWRTARASAEAALEGYEREGENLWPELAVTGVATIAALEGRLDEARRLSSRGLELATASGDTVVAAIHEMTLGFVDLSGDDFGPAVEHLNAAAALVDGIGSKHPGRFKMDGDRAEALVLHGDLDAAAGVVGSFEDVNRDAPTPWTLAVGTRTRGLLEAARGDLEAARMAFDRALAEHERLPMPFERARTLLAAGVVQRRLKQRRAAGALLGEALAIFEELGARAWASKARAELGRVGQRTRDLDELTETERRVAQLAASGMTNREVADVAYLAPKTVENTLARVYRKLGIRSRAELGAWALRNGT